MTVQVVDQKTIKTLQIELKHWKSQEVKENFESVGSTLHLLRVEELKIEIKRRQSK